MDSENVFNVEANTKTLDINVNANKNFELVIPGNITTGFSWYLKDYDTSLVKALNLKDKNSGEYVSDPAPPGYCGVPGKFHFKFQALNIGKGSLTFIHKRPWESSDVAKLAVNININ